MLRRFAIWFGAECCIVFVAILLTYWLWKGVVLPAGANGLLASVALMLVGLLLPQHKLRSK